MAVYTLTSVTPTFINDVIVTRDAAYFTDSSNPVFYRLPLGPGGRLPEAGAVQTIPLGGDYAHVSGLNLNGIEATPNGKTLIAVHSTLGVLYSIDPDTGVARTIDLAGASLTGGDGLLLQGRHAVCRAQSPEPGGRDRPRQERPGPAPSRRCRRARRSTYRPRSPRTANGSTW